MNSGDEERNLSIRLSMIMNKIGASEHIRKIYWDNAMLCEILDTVGITMIKQQPVFSYIFGSKCEGTTTPGLNSDTDVLLGSEYPIVVDSITHAPNPGQSLLMLEDGETRPGYFKLQSVWDGVAQTTHQRDVGPGEERCGVKICKSHEVPYNVGLRTERNGPADTETKFSKYQTDYVWAYRCPYIPNVTSSWIHRERPSKWPSEKQLCKMESYGCFFVGVGHPKSRNKTFEWRISFSLQERQLMSNECLNASQYKCYILLKMIKNDFILPRVEKSISSYHCKTCLFYTIENSTNLAWTDRDLIQCVRACLQLLLTWLREGHCPNYFIPEENMFDRLDRRTLEKVAIVLEGITTSVVEFLFALKCDYVGEVLSSSRGFSIQTLSVKAGNNRRFVGPTSHRFMENVFSVHQAKYRYLEPFSNIDEPRDCLAGLTTFLQDLQDIDCVTEHTREDVQKAMDSIIPHMHLQVAQSFMSAWLTNSDLQHPETIFKVLVHHLLGGHTSDHVSARLILATYYLQSGMLDACEDILLTCESSIKPFAISVCGCHEFESVTTDVLEEEIVARNLSFDEFRSQCTTGCMLILPSQVNFAHQALHYEMYRSTFITLGARDKTVYFWYSWIVVDSQVYMYFLQCILYSKRNSQISKNNAVDKFQRFVNTDPNLGHRETALNLLGWIFVQENRLSEALKCFCRSLRIRPRINAAKWHLALMAYALFIERKPAVS